MIRTWTSLDDDTERHVQEVIDCGVAVHRALGPGFVESVYRNGFCLELQSRKIPFESEKSVTVKYRETPIALHRLDLVVYGSIVVELKAVKCLEPVHQAQLLSYLKASGLRVGLLMNFAGSTLRQGLKRVVL
jgi:GxxExxY protein